MLWHSYYKLLYKYGNYYKDIKYNIIKFYFIY